MRIGASITDSHRFLQGLPPDGSASAVIRPDRDRKRKAVCSYLSTGVRFEKGERMKSVVVVLAILAALRPLPRAQVREAQDPPEAVKEAMTRSSEGRFQAAL